MLLPAMLLVLWLVLMVVLVALCRMAARGDRALGATARRPRIARRRLTRTRTRTREGAPAVTSSTAPARARRATRPRFTMRGSQAAASEDVREGAQEDLDVGPERPVGDVQVVHHRHLP